MNTQTLTLPFYCLTRTLLREIEATVTEALGNRPLAETLYVPEH
jgi:hypothetical protein